MKKPGVKIFVVFDKKILLILRDNDSEIPSPNTWNLPGGGIEENETTENAAKRELREEINIIPKNLIYLGTQTYNDGSVVERYLAKITEEEHKHIKLGREGQKLDFFSIDETVSLNLSNYFKEYLNKYSDQIKTLIESNRAISPESLGLRKQ
ncbi:MAG: NUDIX domain-containing protein [Microgenomates group bacterium]|jgi:8-oxo-dGTP diphosphatase